MNININKDEIITSEKVASCLIANDPCPNCETNFNKLKIKKFTTIDKQFNLEDIDNEFVRCSCGKRHLDVAMVHVLKIMNREGIDLKSFNLRNGAIPLVTPLTSQIKEPYIDENSLIVIHPKLTKRVAKKILSEVSEIKGVLKGNSAETVGMIDSNSDPICYELLAGSDIRCDIIQSTSGEIAINKVQHLSYLEFSNSLENKIMKLMNYFKELDLDKEKIANISVIDGNCGNGTLGIFLLKLGVKKVVFNDIWNSAALMSAINLEANGFKTKYKNFNYNEEFNPSDNKIDSNSYNIVNSDKIASGNNFEVYNSAIEELYEKLNIVNNDKFDLCILDCFPGVNVSNFEKIANCLAKDTLII